MPRGGAAPAAGQPRSAVLQVQVRPRQADQAQARCRHLIEQRFAVAALEHAQRAGVTADGARAPSALARQARHVAQVRLRRIQVFVDVEVQAQPVALSEVEGLWQQVRGRAGVDEPAEHTPALGHGGCHRRGALRVLEFSHRGQRGDRQLHAAGPAGAQVLQHAPGQRPFGHRPVAVAVERPGAVGKCASQRELDAARQLGRRPADIVATHAGDRREEVTLGRQAGSAQVTLVQVRVRIDEGRHHGGAVEVDHRRAACGQRVEGGLRQHLLDLPFGQAKRREAGRGYLPQRRRDVGANEPAMRRQRRQLRQGRVQITPPDAVRSRASGPAAAWPGRRRR